MKKKLKRDQEKAVVAGVMYGLAEYFNQDPVLFRIAAITFLLITGIFPGVILYLAAWIVMSKRDRADVDYTVVE
jgi:phage shock protein C